jgi:hypothetical protein
MFHDSLSPDYSSRPIRLTVSYCFGALAQLADEFSCLGAHHPLSPIAVLKLSTLYPV